MTSPIVRFQPPPAGLGSAAIGIEEETLALDALRRGELFRYYGQDPLRPPPFVAQLEAEACAWLGTRFALATSSGTAALETALAALAIGPGDEVIVPAWSWLSCVTAIMRVGARPVLAEIDASLCLDPAEVARLATSRTRAVLVIHYQGVAADLNPIILAAHQRGLSVIEDCAEAPGASYFGRRLGSWGDVAIFSFQHNKPMTAGEGGLLVTRDPRIYERAVRMHDLGQYRAHHEPFAPSLEPGFAGAQYRMSELTAAVALAQLRKVDTIMAHCRQLQTQLREAIGTPSDLVWRSVPDPAGDFGFELYFYLPNVPQTDRVRTALAERGVPCQQRTGTYPQYRRPHLLTGRTHHPALSPFRDLRPWPAPGYRAEDFPRTEDLTQRFIALPIGWRYTAADIDTIAGHVRDVLAS
jgi:8-amino-3,8-dideoxy-alpha-D-manno-octulosonate transaminase